MEQAGEHHVPAFSTPNFRVQATAYSLRFAAASSRACRVALDASIA
jgi:hypothetical protein